MQSAISKGASASDTPSGLASMPPNQGDLAQTLCFPALIGVVLLGMGPFSCASAASLEPTDAKEDRILEPALLGGWSGQGITYHGRLQIAYLHFSAARGKYRVLAAGIAEIGPWVDAFDADPIKLEGRLFLALSDVHQVKLTGGVGRSFALVKQLHPALEIAFIDQDYLKENPLPGVAGSTKGVQRYLLTAVERGAFGTCPSWARGRSGWNCRFAEHKVTLTPSKATALHFAVARERHQEIKKLIKARADVSVPDEYGLTPLDWAFLFGAPSVDIVELLLTKGADVHARSEKGYTPLHAAAASGSVEAVALLLANGADVNAPQTEKATHRLMIFGIRYGPFGLLQGKGWTPLYAGVSSGSAGVVELLLAKGANVNAKYLEGSTPLMFAADAGSVEIVKLLLAKGADVNARSEKGYTPLIGAASAGSVEIVKLLLAKGADVNAKTEGHGLTPLGAAVRKSSVGVVEVLLANGADGTVGSWLGSPIEATDPKITELLKQHASKK